jgi:hypothetical protein
MEEQFLSRRFSTVSCVEIRGIFKLILQHLFTMNNVGVPAETVHVTVTKSRISRAVEMWAV